MALRTQSKIEAFLRGEASALALVGPSGCGKLFATERAAAAVGLRVQTEDRSQGPLNYTRWGSNSISVSGVLDQHLYVLACADQETDFSGMLSVLRTMPGLKVVLLANEVSNAMRNAKVPVERVSSPSVDQMTKELFLNLGWDCTRAQRLSLLANGDWRRLQTLERLFQGVDVASMSDETFGETLERMARDSHQDIHPTLAAHQLFSGFAMKQGKSPEDLADPSVLAWGEANNAILCESLEDMAKMQDAAVYCDVLTNDGQPQLGLEYWARSASVHGAQGLRYNYASFMNPWSADGKETPAIASARESYSRMRPWLQRARQRIGKAQQNSDAKPTPKRKTATKKVVTKRAATGKR